MSLVEPGNSSRRRWSGEVGCDRVAVSCDLARCQKSKVECRVWETAFYYDMPPSGGRGAARRSGRDRGVVSWGKLHPTHGRRVADRQEITMTNPGEITLRRLWATSVGRRRGKERRANMLFDVGARKPPGRNDSRATMCLPHASHVTICVGNSKGA